MRDVEVGVVCFASALVAVVALCMCTVARGCSCPATTRRCADCVARVLSSPFGRRPSSFLGTRRTLEALEARNASGAGVASLPLHTSTQEAIVIDERMAAEFPAVPYVLEER